MRILFLTHRLPYPPDKGERIRAFHQLKYLAARHEVDLFCLADSSADMERYLADLQKICRNVHVVVLNKLARLGWAMWAFLVGRPLSFGYFWSREFQHIVRDSLTLGQYDLVFVNCSSMAQYIPRPKPAPLIVDFVDADSHKFLQYANFASVLPLRMLYTLEAKRVAAAERATGCLADLSLVITKNDAQELGASVWTGSRIEILANGTDVPPDVAIRRAAKELQPFILFLGTMSYLPNADAAGHFARDIFPKIRSLNPDLKFVIAGRKPGKQVQELAREPGVMIVSSVSDPFEYFRAAAVSVAPFRISQGFHNKIAESLAVGTPVVASRRAASAIGLTQKEGLFTAVDSDDFARQVVEIVSNHKLRQALKESAYVVQNQLSWDYNLRKLSAYLAEVVDDAAPTCRAKVLAGSGG